ncbi:putative pyrazinamidase/nicotinamidase [Mycobacterium kansasii 824]|nr:putative pyrazinamidase/nicotinamidase [Mycobacterium kansasii 824]
MVATEDFHIDPGDHFSDQPDYCSSWPAHCRAGSRGADFHPDLDTGHLEAVFRKGAYGAAYSGAEGVDEHGTTLPDWLRQRGSTRSTWSASPPIIACGAPPRTWTAPASRPGCWST